MLLLIERTVIVEVFTIGCPTTPVKTVVLKIAFLWCICPRVRKSLSSMLPCQALWVSHHCKTKLSPEGSSFKIPLMPGYLSTHSWNFNLSSSSFKPSKPISQPYGMFSKWKVADDGGTKGTLPNTVFFTGTLGSVLLLEDHFQKLKIVSDYIFWYVSQLKYNFSIFVAGSGFSTLSKNGFNTKNSINW